MVANHFLVHLFNQILKTSVLNATYSCSQHSEHEALLSGKDKNGNFIFFY